MVKKSSPDEAAQNPESNTVPQQAWDEDEQVEVGVQTVHVSFPDSFVVGAGAVARGAWEIQGAHLGTPASFIRSFLQLEYENKAVL